MNAHASVSDRSVALPLWRPVFAATLAAAMMALLMFASDGMPANAALGMSLFAGVIGFFHVFVLGIPYAFWMHRIGRFNVLTMGLGGFVIGAAPFGLATWDPWVFAVFGGIGAGCALAFYAVSLMLMRGR